MENSYFVWQYQEQSVLNFDSYEKALSGVE